jgi:hypothetical protein
MVLYKNYTDYPYLNKHHTMKTMESVEIKINHILSLENGWSKMVLADFIPGIQWLCPLDVSFCETQNHSGLCGEERNL